MNGDIQKIFRQTSSVNFVSGKRGSGKTDFSLLLLQNGKEIGLFDEIAANIATRNDPSITYIGYFDRLETWLKGPGKKGFILDEMGKHLYKMSFMSKLSKVILGVCQLVRKFDAHLIGIAPSEELVNKMFFNTDILDSHMVKLSKRVCLIQNYTTETSYIIKRLPRTKIRFLTKDIAAFGLNDPAINKEEYDSMPREQKSLILYAIHHNTRAVAKILGVSHVTVAADLQKVTAKYKNNPMLSVR